jgi:EAL domain-containing protein (putative c-di-GMP-specific phosphodiesterase class I)
MEGASLTGVEVMKDAQLALKRAKVRQRGSAVYFSESIRTKTHDRIRLLKELRDAFALNRMYVAYQPQVMMDSGIVTGVEALLRWPQVDNSFVIPDTFIPLAEASGLILAMGEFVLRTALLELKHLHDAGHTSLKMSVNVSRLQLRNTNFIGVLSSALAESAVPPDAVELEITESVAMENLEGTREVLQRLRATGVTISIDDFGTGHSSLSVLQQLKVQRLKLDKSFVQALGVGDEPSVIAQLVVNLANSLKLGIIAEGVETVAQKQELLSMGCLQAQGYLFAKAMTAEQLDAWLTGAPGQTP